MEPLVVPIWSTSKDKVTAATLLGMHQNKIKDLVYGGELVSFKLGGRRVIAVSDLRAYIDRLRDEEFARSEQPTNAA